MKRGKMFLNNGNNRMDVCFEDGSTDGGLHCGTCLEVLIDEKWVSTSLECHSCDDYCIWYLVDLKDIELIGLEVKL